MNPLVNFYSPPQSGPTQGVRPKKGVFRGTFLKPKILFLKICLSRAKWGAFEPMRPILDLKMKEMNFFQ